MRGDPRLLPSFVALATELHFGRAAKTLGIAQPALSQQIARLELQLGVELFARTRRSVELTDAGRELLPLAQAAVDAAQSLDRLAAGIARGEQGELRVGLSPGAHYLAEEILAAFRSDRPGVRIRSAQDSSGALAAQVASGALDVAIGFCADPPAGARCEVLVEQRAVLAVPAGHRLAERGPVPLGAARKETFALVDAHDGAGYNRAVVDRCRAAGFEPGVVANPSGPMAWETAVRREGSVGLTTRASAMSTAHGIRLVDLDPPVTFPIELVRPDGGKERPAPIAGAFARTARAAVCARHHPPR